MSLLEGINSKTTKTELIGRLERAQEEQDRTAAQERSKVKEVEARLKAKYVPEGVKLQRIVLVASDPELEKLTEFLSDIEEVAPIAALRLLEGLRLLKEPAA